MTTLFPLRPSRRSVVATAFALVGTVVFAAALTQGDFAADALKSAGAFNGNAVGGVAGFVDKIKGNLVWLAGTLLAIGVIVLGLMFMVGHQRANDWAMKFVVGVLIVGCGSGIVA